MNDDRTRLWLRGRVLAQLAAACCSRRSAKDDFLPPEKAYRYTTRVEGDRLIVAWDIEQGYYLYKKKMGVVSATPARSSASRSGRRAKITPTSTSARRRSIAAKSKCRCRSSSAARGPRQLTLELRLQGCADAGLCYPPQKWKTEVKLPRCMPAAAD